MCVCVCVLPYISLVLCEMPYCVFGWSYLLICLFAKTSVLEISYVCKKIKINNS